MLSDVSHQASLKQNFQINVFIKNTLHEQMRKIVMQKAIRRVQICNLRTRKQIAMKYRFQIFKCFIIIRWTP